MALSAVRHTLSLYHESGERLITPMIAGSELNLNSVPPRLNSLTRALAAASCSSSNSARCSSLSICWGRYHPKLRATSPDPVGGAIVLFDQALAEQRSQRRIHPVRVLFEDSSLHGFPRDLSP